MPVPHFESFVRKRAREIKRGFTRAHLIIAFRSRERARDRQCDSGEDADLYFDSSFALMRVMILPTASLTFFTSSAPGALPGGKETSFSTAGSSPLTSLTSGSSFTSPE